MNNEEQPLKLGRQPAFYKADVIRRFGQVKYSCQPTFESWFHTIKADGWSAYIEEYDDEVIGTVYIGGVHHGYGDEDFAKVLDWVDSTRNGV